MLEKTKSIQTILSASVCAVVMAGMVSCSSDESLIQNPVDNVITFTTNVTRASGTAWDANDKIGVYQLTENGGLSASGEGQNRTYMTVDKATFVPASTSDALTYPKDGSKVKFVAYYPYQAGLQSDMLYTVNIADQQTPSNIDFMYAPLTNAYSSGSPVLTFSHKLAQVSVTLTSTDGKDLSDVKVVLQQVPTTVRYDVLNGAFKEPASSMADVQMYHASGTTTSTFTAFLIPGTYADGVKMVISDGATVSKPVTLTKGEAAVTTFTSGNNYTFTAKVSGIGKDVSVTPSTDKGNYFMETPTLTASELNNTSLIYKTYTFDKGRGQERNYSMLFDKTKKMALWVAYPLNKSYTGSLDRDGIQWTFDSDIDRKYQINVTKKSYPDAGTQSGFNRGHQIPNSDRNGNIDSQKQTFLVTNQTPQNNAMNGGIWQNLEKAVRNYANGTDTLFVVTGPLFEKNIGTDMDNDGVAITRPSSYFKAVASVVRDAAGNVTSAKTIAYIIPNDESVKGTPYANYVMSVKEVEARAKFTLFPAVPDQYKNSKSW